MALENRCREGLRLRRIVLNEMATRGLDIPGIAEVMFPGDTIGENKVGYVLACCHTCDFAEDWLRRLGYSFEVEYHVQKLNASFDEPHAAWSLRDEKTGWEARWDPRRDVYVVSNPDGETFITHNRPNAKDMLRLGRWRPLAVRGDGTPIEDDPQDVARRSERFRYEHSGATGWAAMSRLDGPGYLILCPDGQELIEEDWALAIRMMMRGEKLESTDELPLRERISSASVCRSREELHVHKRQFEKAYVALYIETGMHQGFTAIGLLDDLDQVRLEESVGYLYDGQTYAVTDDALSKGEVTLVYVGDVARTADLVRANGGVQLLDGV